jgi:hypothetical protein
MMGNRHEYDENTDSIFQSVQFAYEQSGELTDIDPSTEARRKKEEQAEPKEKDAKKK